MELYRVVTHVALVSRVLRASVDEDGPGQRQGQHTVGGRTEVLLGYAVRGLRQQS